MKRMLWLIPIIIIIWVWTWRIGVQLRKVLWPNKAAQEITEVASKDSIWIEDKNLGSDVLYRDIRDPRLNWREKEQP